MKTLMLTAVTALFALGCAQKKLTLILLIKKQNK